MPHSIKNNNCSPSFTHEPNLNQLFLHHNDNQRICNQLLNSNVQVTGFQNGFSCSQMDVEGEVLFTRHS